MKINNKTTGFTLIELMIVVVVIGILASIAYPSYQDYVKKSRRADGKGAVLSVQLAEEKWRANNITYTSTLVDDLGLLTTSPDNYYNLTITNNTANTYTITATHTGVQTSDTDCKTFSIDESGNKTSTDSSDTANTICW